jgi:hypothetical protein
MARLRRFAIGRNTRLVFDYLRMTDNTCRPTAA